MSESTSEATMSPRPRTIGIVWLLYFAVGILSALLTKGIVAHGDAAATAHNILAHPALWQAGISVDILANAIYLALTALLYEFFRPVNRTYALMAAFFSVAGCIVQIMVDLLRMAGPVALADAQLTGAFSAQQVNVSTLFGLTMFSRAYFISYPLFALFELTLGYLLLQAAFPKWLGIWWLVSGSAGLLFLWPPLGTPLRTVIIAINLAEFVLPILLLIKGGDASRWRRTFDSSRERVAVA
ncbi:MAG TPA: DUF4386 domain-containing protein [Gemmatimonadaceae bacterium]|nr:DUF4386 domain-containing protein [Gemmatimonadaceae bacterium]